MTTCRDCGAQFEPEPTPFSGGLTIRCAACRRERADDQIERKARKRDGAKQEKQHRCARSWNRDPPTCPICRKPMLECNGRCMEPEQAQADHALMVMRHDLWIREHRKQKQSMDVVFHTPPTLGGGANGDQERIDE